MWGWVLRLGMTQTAEGSLSLGKQNNDSIIFLLAAIL
jgi:hypothetical protein